MSKERRVRIRQYVMMEDEDTMTQLQALKMKEGMESVLDNENDKNKIETGSFLSLPEGTQSCEHFYFRLYISYF